jgi:hypothetical protein
MPGLDDSGCTWCQWRLKGAMPSIHRSGGSVPLQEAVAAIRADGDHH